MRVSEAGSAEVFAGLVRGLKSGGGLAFNRGEG